MPKSSTTFLVTGGAGFIGSRLVWTLVEHGHAVRVLDDLSTGRRSRVPAGVDFVFGDVADPETVLRAADGVDGIFHLAAVASVDRCNRDWAAAHRTNQTGSVTVFEAARRLGPVPVVWASSAAVYGAAGATALTEDTPTRPLSPYGVDKLGSELHGLVAADLFGVPNTALRFFNVFGPGQDPASPYSGVISIFSDRIADGRTLLVHGDGLQSRDFVYVGDVVDAQRRAMDRLLGLQGGARFDAINVCTGHATTLLDLIRTLSSLAGRHPRVEHVAPRLGDIRVSLGDRTRMENLLGDFPPTPLIDGLDTLLRAGRSGADAA